MAKIWKWVAGLCGVMLLLAAILIVVAYFTGGSLERLLATTDIADMTKFFSRDQLESFVTAVFRFFGAA